MGLWLALLIALVTAISVTAETIEGRPRVVDGDTLVFGMKRVRLHGIDAPEAKQQCQRRDGRAYDCGRSPQSRCDVASASGPCAARATGTTDTAD